MGQILYSPLDALVWSPLDTVGQWIWGKQLTVGKKPGAPSGTPTENTKPEAEIDLVSSDDEADARGHRVRHLMANSPSLSSQRPPILSKLKVENRQWSRTLTVACSACICVDQLSQQPLQLAMSLRLFDTEARRRSTSLSSLPAVTPPIAAAATLTTPVDTSGTHTHRGTRRT